MTTAIVLQARMGSRRLPGKSLAIIDGRTVLRRCIDRLNESGLPVVVATSSLETDDPIEREADKAAVPVVRDAETDVLARYARAVELFELELVVRATGDNPAVDLEAPGRVVELAVRTGADHVTEHGLPYGAAVEAVSARALLTAARSATESADREHVTTFIRRDRQFRRLVAVAPAAVRRHDLRFTVDTADDLDYMRRVFALAGRGAAPAPLAALIAAADQTFVGASRPDARGR